MLKLKNLNINKPLKQIMLSTLKPFNPLTPRGDQHATSPKNIGILSRQQVMRILKIIR